MLILSIGLLIALFAVLSAEFVNGWTDAPNAIATVVSTGVMTPRQAVLMAVVFNTIGAMSGTAVAATVGKGIVVPAVLTVYSITATMISIIIWEFWQNGQYVELSALGVMMIVSLFCFVMLAQYLGKKMGIKEA